MRDPYHRRHIEAYHREETRNLGLVLIPEQYVALSVDFARRRFRCEIATVGQAHAEAVFRLLTTGLGLLSVELPREHAYLEAHLLKFAEDHADTGKNVFLIVRFQPESPFPVIVSTIRDACAAHGLDVLRADDREYTDDIWDNVMTYMYACASAIAVFDQINYREFNPNVALEVGFMLAQRKPVLLLKDTAIHTLPADIVGKSYRPFNTYDPAGTIPPQIEKWIVDYRIGA
jgi:nucleoside 2-deoxyribosyltransferase